MWAELFLLTLSTLKSPARDGGAAKQWPARCFIRVLYLIAFCLVKWKKALKACDLLRRRQLMGESRMADKPMQLDSPAGEILAPAESCSAAGWLHCHSNKL